MNMKNYYEILEVSENASQEVIEKAYKALAKKYHPDVQRPNNVKSAEEKFKEIGEAYETLSNKERKEIYDLELSKYKSNSQSNYSNTDYENLLVHTQELENELEYLKKEQTYENQKNEAFFKNSLDDIKSSLNETIQKAYSDAYHDAYINEVGNYRYNQKRKSFKTYLKNFIALILTVFIIAIILFILWQIPLIRNHLINLYNDNYLIQLLINPFIKN